MIILLIVFVVAVASGMGHDIVQHPAFAIPPALLVCLAFRKAAMA